MGTVARADGIRCAAGTGRTMTALRRRLLEEAPMNLVLLLIIVFVLIAVLPTWPYSGSWGYYPSGGLGLILVVLLVLVLMGRV
jgi:hypothetical protein